MNNKSTKTRSRHSYHRDINEIQRVFPSPSGPESRHKNIPTNPSKAPNTPPTIGTVFPPTLSAAALLVELATPPLDDAVPTLVAKIALLEVTPVAFPVPEVVTAAVDGGIVGAAPPEVESIPEGKAMVPIPLQTTFDSEDNCINTGSVSCAGQWDE